METVNRSSQQPVEAPDFERWSDQAGRLADDAIALSENVQAIADALFGSVPQAVAKSHGEPLSNGKAHLLEAQLSRLAVNLESLDHAVERLHRLV